MVAMIQVDLWVKLQMMRIQVIIRLSTNWYAMIVRELQLCKWMLYPLEKLVKELLRKIKPLKLGQL